MAILLASMLGACEWPLDIESASRYLAGTDRLNANEHLSANEEISSGDTFLAFQGDGNLVLYQDGRAIWASNEFGSPTDFYMQGDCNAVAYQSGGVLWASNTVGEGTTCHAQVVPGDWMVCLGTVRKWSAMGVGTCTTGGGEPGGFQGCYTDGESRALPAGQGDGFDNDTCKARCLSLEYAYAGSQYGGECWCGNSLGYAKMDDSACNMECSVNRRQTCGAAWHNSIFATGFTPAGWRPTPEQVKAVKANYLGSRDSRGRILFDPFYISLTDEERAEWRQIKRAAGLTHFVLAPSIGYPGYPIPGRNLIDQPQEFRRFVVEILDAGFVPIVMVSTGDAGTGDHIDRDFPKVLDGLADLAPYALWVPGWEVVGPGGGWTSNQLSRAIYKIRERLGPSALIYVHLTPDRPTGASNPLEDDDPWQGDEIGFWYSHGGEQLTGLLYQTVHGDALLHPIDTHVLDRLAPGEMGLCYERFPDGRDYSDHDWRCRMKEITDRLLYGYRGWRRVEVVLFETIAYDYLRAGATEQDATRIADDGAKLGIKWFGNGLPSGGGGGG